MKASDSTNSLTGLTEEVRLEVSSPSCFICLEELNEKEEPLVDSILLRTCGCQFKVHPACWNEWMKDKTDYDCPICRKKSLTQGKSPVPLAPISEWPTTERRVSWILIRLSVAVLAIVIASVLIFKMMEG